MVFLSRKTNVFAGLSDVAFHQCISVKSVVNSFSFTVSVMTEAT